MRKSARLKRFRNKRSKDRVPHDTLRLWSIAKKVVILLLIAIFLFVFVKLNTKYWNGVDKLGFTFPSGSGDVGILVADPKLGELTLLTIPGETQVEVARNYGSLRMKNVWKLSENEKLKGKLLPETTMQNFLFPLFLWSDAAGEKLVEGSLGGVTGFIFKPGSSNIPFGDRLNLGLFALKVGTLGKNSINLGESQFLVKQKLNDGEVGYKLNSTPSERLTVYFVDEEMVARTIKVYIVDETGETGIAEKVGQIIEVLGGKVVSIEKRAPASSECEIKGGSETVNRKIARYFSCNIIKGETNFDVEIKLGKDFATRF